MDNDLDELLGTFGLILLLGLASVPLMVGAAFVMTFAAMVVVQ